ncbi:MAG: threonylcarbamoyl-AMP synthase [bacterium]|nr:threonylcarbamoyl-AMP synthase [bacterium]
MSAVLPALSTPATLRRCVETLDAGGVIAVPTETVYGLICRAGRDDAMRRIVDMKRRPGDKPFALFVRRWSDLAGHAPPCAMAQRLADALWPGPLTLVAAAHPECPAERDGSVGARSPDYPVLQDLLAECGGLLINTSLNRSGEPPARSLDDAGALIDEVDLALDAGQLPRRSPSTVVDCRGSEPKILRVGEIGEDRLRSVLGLE